MAATTARVQKLVKAIKGVAATPAAAGSPPLGAAPVAPRALPLTHTALSAIDALRLTTAFGSALLYPGGRFDAVALEQALAALVAELPALAGRLVPPQLSLGLGSAAIAHSNEGALMVIADEPGRQLEQCGPGSWPQRGILVDHPPLPFYAEPINTAAALRGKEPLLKVRVTRMADGDVLALTLSHVFTDGVRVSLLLSQLAARYRQAVAALGGSGTAEAPPFSSPVDDRKSVLSVDAMRRDLGGSFDGWEPKPLVVSPSLFDYLLLLWARLCAALHPARADCLFLHVPGPRVDALRAAAMAAAAAGERTDDPELGCGHISRGDAAQALAALLIHIATGAEPVPGGVRHFTVLVQVPSAKALPHANAMHLLPVSAPGKLQHLPAAGDHGANHALLSALIRRASDAWAASPRMWAQDVPDFGLPGSTAPASMQHLFTPLSAGMSIIRPAQPPYAPGGLTLQFCLTAQQQRALAASGAVAALAPDATWLGGEGLLGGK